MDLLQCFHVSHSAFCDTPVVQLPCVSLFMAPDTRPAP